MRKYYIECCIICDKCGIKDYLDDGITTTVDDLDYHIDKYFKKHNGSDLCLDCYEEEGEK